MRILYITYDGLNDALGQSQIIPYLNGLSSRGYDITVLSFEKKSGQNILDKNIHWKSLRYNKYPLILSTCYDILKGLMTGAGLLLRRKIVIIHARGYVPALIGLLLKRLFRAKFIFDMRGMWPEEKVDAGAWKNEGFLFKIAKYLERFFLGSAEK